jgi:hypothetical protein
MGDASPDAVELQAFHLTELATGWSFRQTDSNDAVWLPVRSIPSNVHQDLIDSKV